jgi:diaminohydroxyphosphoribosylaminopyrimidine deaminase/5-amino-6-(5-phosphoribosylamino)uracil reductase
MGIEDERFMDAALELARAPGFTSPNPRVGAVVVQGGVVVASGAHHGAGSAHAEAVALAHGDARGATLYVTLEPCAHHGRTPPCAPAIVKAGVTRVVAAMEDPDERVRGRGFAHLREHGVEVAVGVGAAAAHELNAAWIHKATTGRPLVTVKLALSLDGRLAASDGSARWITSASARRHVHARRLEVDAVLCGAGTVIADDPLLTVRDVPSSRQPLRVVVDAAGRTPPSSRVLDGGAADVMVATTADAPHDVQTAWKERGAEIVVLPATTDGVDLRALVDALAARGIVEIYCEGGARLATALLAGDLVDGLDLYYGPVLLGGGGPALGDLGVATMDDARRWKVVETRPLDDDVFVKLRRGR